ncbi:hypothetical protein [Actinacidiphila soli]|uniref:hypothetical protein n=1 Tax=Actinacidiphila soli TaxID=2487275 RepID=UPI000FCB7CFB|nr:hypothetical protein [Actinacidiphila soli]
MSTNEPQEPTAARIRAEAEQCYRYEISATMNAVVRACAVIIRDYSHRGFWYPADDTSHEGAHHLALIHSARRHILHRLQLTITAAETVFHDIETEHDRHRNDPNNPTE